MRDAVACMKRVVQACVLKGRFEYNPETPGLGTLLAEMMGVASEQLVQAIVFDVANPEEPIARVKLDAGTSSYLTAMEEVRTSGPGLLAHEIAKEEMAARFRETMLSIISATTTADADANTASLRSALEWAFDAAADQDPAVSFIKTCIALEAALGEDQEQSQITERLADRCAFLLNETVTERMATRETIRKIYTLRSSLVHGKKRSFSADDSHLRIVGGTHLDLVLKREIRAIEKSRGNA